MIDWFLVAPPRRRALLSRQRGFMQLRQWPGDPYWSNVVMMNHGNTGTPTNSASRGNTVTTVSAALDSSVYKWGLGSYHVSAQNGGIFSATHADYNFSTNDWTVELWVYPNSLTREYDSSKVYFDMRGTLLTAAWVPTLSANNGTGNLRYFANGGERINGGDVMVATTWQHIAVCRASGSTRLFYNGTQVGATFTDSNTYVQQQMCVACAGNTGGTARGRYDDIRVTNGTGRYTASFEVYQGQFWDYGQ